MGGEQLEAALPNMADFGRIVVCGMVSQYSLSESDRYGIKNLVAFGRKNVTMRLFLVLDEDMAPAYTEEFEENMSKWLYDGSIKAQMSVTDGMDFAAKGHVDILTRQNFGKAVLKMADPD